MHLKHGIKTAMTLRPLGLCSSCALRSPWKSLFELISFLRPGPYWVFSHSVTCPFNYEGGCSVFPVAVSGTFECGFKHGLWFWYLWNAVLCAVCGFMTFSGRGFPQILMRFAVLDKKFLFLVKFSENFFAKGKRRPATRFISIIFVHPARDSSMLCRWMRSEIMTYYYMGRGLFSRLSGENMDVT